MIGVAASILRSVSPVIPAVVKISFPVSSSFRTFNTESYVKPCLTVVSSSSRFQACLAFWIACARWLPEAAFDCRLLTPSMIARSAVLASA